MKLGKAMRLARNAKGNSPEAILLRTVGAWAFTEMCALLDDYIREDVKAGARPRSCTPLRSAHRNTGHHWTGGGYPGDHRQHAR